MSRYSLAFKQTATPASLGPWVVLRAPPGGRVLRIKQIQLSVATGAQAEFGITWAAATVPTITLANSLTANARDPRDVAATALLDTTWGVAPTLPGAPIYTKYGLIGGTVGNGVTFGFDDVNPLIVVPGALGAALTQLGIWNTAGGVGPALTVNIDWDE